jgi:ABC-type nitrate/sulfonate/bicarbonate transport system ATPase subunit
MILRRAYHYFLRRPEPIIDVRDCELGWEGLATLAGPSGSGKTTLFRLLSAWYDSPESLCLFEPTIDRYRNVRFIGAHEGLMPWKSVVGNMSTGGIKGAAAEAMLVDLGLSQTLGDAPVYELSYGMYKRLELGIAIAAEPTLLLVDELFSSIDDVTKALIRDYIIRLRPTAQTWIIAHEEALRRWLSPVQYSLEVDGRTRCVTAILRR